MVAVLLSVLQHGLAPRDIEEMLEVGYIIPSHGLVGAGFASTFCSSIYSAAIHKFGFHRKIYFTGLLYCSTAYAWD